MTTTGVPAGLDLSWIIFSGEEHGTDCKFRECSAQATHLGVFEPLVGCEHGARNPYCLAHRDRILAQAEVNGNSFCCPLCPGTKWRLLRMERL